MKVFLRLMLEVILLVVLFPLIVFINLVWLVVCIRSTRYFDGTIKDGVMYWLHCIKTSLEMNKDFVVNGL